MTNINIYPRNTSTENCLNGIRENAFNRDLRFKYVTATIENDFAQIEWESQSGDESMLPEFYAEVKRCLKYLNFTGTCEIHVYDRNDSFDVFETYIF